MPWLDFVPIAERRWPAHFVADAESAPNQQVRQLKLRLRRLYTLSQPRSR
jgi:hypothetical protein